MNKPVLIVFAIIVAMPFYAAYAHTTVEVEPYEIEVGWGVEPPIAGLRNTIVYSITEASGQVRSGVVGALADVEVTLRFGGLEQAADILNDPRPGDYYTKIIPSRVGSYHVAMTGQINGTEINVVIPIEDAQSAAALNFPPSQGADNEDIAALRSAVVGIQRELDSASGEPVVDGAAYDIALFGAAFGIAGTVLAVIAMAKRR